MLLRICFACLLLATLAQAADCPQFGRTADRNMVSPERDLPDQVASARNGQAAVNLKWVARLGSKCYGAPAVADGRVYIGTNNAYPQVPARGGDRGVLQCLDEKTGRFLWQLAVPKYRGIKSFDLAGLGICSTPYVEKDRLYLVSNRCDVLALATEPLGDGHNRGPFTEEARYYAAAPSRASASAPATVPAGKTYPQDADILWRYDMLEDLDLRPHDAANCSPLVHGELLFICTSNGVNAGHKVSDSPTAPTLIALNKNTGALAAIDTENISRRVYHGNWSSPALAQVGRRTLVLLGGGDGVCYAFDAQPTPPAPGAQCGKLSLVWAANCNPPERRGRAYKAKNGPSEIIATPVAYRDRVYVAVGQDPNHKYGLGNLLCLNADTGAIVWQDSTVNRSLSTVAVVGDLLFLTDFSGVVYCYDAATGKRHWAHATEQDIWASPLVADGKLYVATAKGTLLIFAAAREKKLLWETSLGAPIHCSPVAANGTLYVATDTHLYAFGR